MVLQAFKPSSQGSLKKKKKEGQDLEVIIPSYSVGSRHVQFTRTLP